MRSDGKTLECASVLLFDLLFLLDYSWLLLSLDYSNEDVGESIHIDKLSRILMVEEEGLEKTE